VEFVQGVPRRADRRQNAGVGVGTRAGFCEDLFEGQSFKPLDSEQAAARLDHLVDEEVFVFAFGLELAAEADGEIVEVVGVLVREDIEDSGETMAGRVTAEICFPSGVFGPVELAAFCRFARICAVVLISLPSFYRVWCKESGVWTSSVLLVTCRILNTYPTL
jgi:hypothetical protein